MLPQLRRSGTDGWRHRCTAASFEPPGFILVQQPKLRLLGHAVIFFFFLRTTMLFSPVVSPAEGSTNSTRGFLFLKASPTLTFFVVFGHYQTRRCEV